MTPRPLRSGRGAIAGVLLAAGTSSRMGRNKMLFALDGESVLRRAALARTDPADEAPIEVLELCIDPVKRIVTVRGEPVQITFVEFEIARKPAGSRIVTVTRHLPFTVLPWTVAAWALAGRASASTATACARRGSTSTTG